MRPGTQPCCSSRCCTAWPTGAGPARRSPAAGHLRLAICGGAPLPPDIARLFLGLGLPLLQGYGLTETAPVISVNRLDDNLPASVGRPLPGGEVRLGEQDELQVRGPNVMLGYWHNTAATRALFTPDGWLRTGDTARIDAA
ncbi:MAG: AMP-binding protein [Halothiobacillaceae bacterium]